MRINGDNFENFFLNKSATLFKASVFFTSHPFVILVPLIEKSNNGNAEFLAFLPPLPVFLAEHFGRIFWQGLGHFHAAIIAAKI